METTSYEPRRELTVEELARHVGMTVRNLREWQALGLLPPPERRGRVGIYNAGHIARVRRVKELKADGFRLDLIRRILDADEDAPDADVRRMATAVLEPFQADEPRTLPADELLRRLKMDDGPRAEPDALAALADAGLLRSLDGGRVLVHSPRLIGILEELVTLGFTIGDLLVPFARIRRHHDRIAHIIVGIYRDQIWEPFVRAGMPPQGWHRVASGAEQLRPLLYDAIMAAFQVAMDNAARHAIIENADRLPPELITGPRTPTRQDPDHP